MRRDSTIGHLAAGSGALMREAVLLAEDGEIGNSDAIRLLQIPHSSEEIKALLAAFDRHLTPQARAKLTLDMFVPLPHGVSNQRWEPIFDRYPVSGRTYRTASGTTVLEEVQYYNGRMVQVYGECSNVSAIEDVLAGSGYKAMTIRHAVRQTAVVQFWAHRLSDTSLHPYDAAFIIVAAVPESECGANGCIEAHETGTSSVLPMFDGAFDPDTGRFVSRVKLYYVRLLDSTHVAIDVGRERMGTDKRPGSVELRREGSQVRYVVRDSRREMVAAISFTPASSDHAYLNEIARAARTAGLAFCELPQGTEYVFPSIARIGNGPTVNWQWRTDLRPRLQPVNPGEVLFDSRSEEGAMLQQWGFTPRVLGYLPNVRGVVTGIGEPSSRHLRVRMVPMR